NEIIVKLAAPLRGPVGAGSRNRLAVSPMASLRLDVRIFDRRLKRYPVDALLGQLNGVKTDPADRPGAASKRRANTAVSRHRSFPCISQRRKSKGLTG